MSKFYIPSTIKALTSFGLGLIKINTVSANFNNPKNINLGALLLFEGIEGIPICALYFPLDFEGKIH